MTTPPILNKAADKVTGKTLVPLSLILTLLGGSGGVIATYATIQENSVAIAQTNKRQDRIEERIYQKLDSIESELRDLNTRLAHIE